MNIDELFEKKYDSLPSVIKDIINSAAAAKVIDSLSGILKLDEVQKEMLTEEILLVLFSENSVTDFKKNLVWNILLTENQADLVVKEVDSTLFKPVRKFLKNTESKPIFQTSTALRNEDISHHELLNEIENPTPSLQTTIENTPKGNEKPVSAVTVMPKDAQKLMTQSDTLPTETTSAPQLQDAVAQILPNVGGFKPVDDPLKPTQKIADTIENKLNTVVKTPVKEVYIPKKPDPYREPIE